jgi:hypothetical protein
MSAPDPARNSGSGPEPVSRITLRALQGQPLDDQSIRGMVVATAQAIAERQGVEVMELRTAPDRITVTLNVGRIAAMGFAAELRRLTTRWYTTKFGALTLWGEPPAEEGEEWKSV